MARKSARNLKVRCPLNLDGSRTVKETLQRFRLLESNPFLWTGMAGLLLDHCYRFFLAQHYSASVKVDLHSSKSLGGQVGWMGRMQGPQRLARAK